MKMLVLTLSLYMALLTGCAAIVTKPASNAQPLTLSAESAKHIVLNVTGSDAVTGSKDWTWFKRLWPNAMKAEVEAAGRRLTIQEGDTKPAEPGTLVIVYINDYRGAQRVHDTPWVS